MTVEADLYDLISGAAAFSTYGTRIYPHEAPQNATKPYATYYRVPGTQRVHTMGANDAGVVWARFQFDTWGDKPLDTITMREVIREILRNHSGTNSVTIERILIDGDGDHPKEDDSKTFHSSVDAMVIYRE